VSAIKARFYGEEKQSENGSRYAFKISKEACSRTIAHLGI
jgi:hypothetical protein